MGFVVRRDNRVQQDAFPPWSSYAPSPFSGYFLSSSQSRGPLPALDYTPHQPQTDQAGGRVECGLCSKQSTGSHAWVPQLFLDYDTQKLAVLARIYGSCSPRTSGGDPRLGSPAPNHWEDPAGLEEAPPFPTSGQLGHGRVVGVSVR